MKKILVFLILLNLYYNFEYNKKELKVFIIEVNSILYSVTNKDFYKNNSGYSYISEYFSQNRERAVLEMIEDIKYGSHDQLKVKIVKYTLFDEFPKYTIKVKLLDDKYDYQYDEETYIYMAHGEDTPEDKGDWIKLIRHPLFVCEFNFDYDYLIDKYNLDTLRQKNFFGQVWIFSVDLLGAFETMMVVQIHIGLIELP